MLSIVPFHFQNPPIFQILFHCLKSNLPNTEIKVLYFDFSVNVALPQQQQPQRQLQECSFPDHYMKKHNRTFWLKSPSCREQHSSVPYENQCPRRTSQVALTQDTGLPFPGDKGAWRKRGLKSLRF